MRHYMLGLLLVASYCLMAQQTAALSIFSGASTYLGDLEPEDITPSLDAAHLSIGLRGSIPLKQSVFLRAGLSYHSLEGSDKRHPDPLILAIRGFSFSTQLIEGNMQLLWEPLASRRYPTSGGYKNIISPYIFAGFGIAFFDPNTDYNEPLEGDYISRVQKDKEAEKSPAFVIPFGAGLRFDLSKSLSLGAELGIRKTNSDYLDGISVSGSINTDWYVSGGLSLTYRWSKPDYDRDGFMDDEDLCPQGAGPDYTQGCPDSDGDQIPDNIDKCPYQVGKANANGCPDNDYDGVADFMDKCPEIPGHATAQGCIDTDGDGIADDDDMCPNCAGSKGLSGCPDADGDGVEDSRDRCPNIKGSLSSAGCPFMDEDFDGVSDKNDACPTIRGLKKFDGCPDSDADGIVDSQDKCPNLAGSLINNGCPELTDEIKASLALMTQAIQFETGSDLLKEKSKETLQELVDIMKTHNYLHLSIEGHTDNRGKEANNLSLSQERAEACYNFLKEKGILANQMAHKGFGESKPIATNDTEEGRSKNRRVTFDLFVE